MYYDRELMDLFKTFTEEVPEKDPHFMILTGTKEEMVYRWAEESCLGKDRVLVKKAKWKEVPDYLSAGDIGLSGMRQTPSKVYSSPIKHAEYWGCGLPVMIFRGVSEDDIRVEEEKSGVIVEEVSEASYRKAVREMIELLREDGRKLRENCRGTAIKERSLENAAQITKDALVRRTDAWMSDRK